MKFIERSDLRRSSKVSNARGSLGSLPCPVGRTGHSGVGVGTCQKAAGGHRTGGWHQELPLSRQTLNGTQGEAELLNSQKVSPEARLPGCECWFHCFLAV